MYIYVFIYIILMYINIRCLFLFFFFSFLMKIYVVIYICRGTSQYLYAVIEIGVIFMTINKYRARFLIKGCTFSCSESSYKFGKTPRPESQAQTLAMCFTF